MDVLQQHLNERQGELKHLVHQNLALRSKLVSLKALIADRELELHESLAQLSVAGGGAAGGAAGAGGGAAGGDVAMAGVPPPLAPPPAAAAAAAAGPAASSSGSNMLSGSTGAGATAAAAPAAAAAYAPTLGPPSAEAIEATARAAAEHGLRPVGHTASAAAAASPGPPPPVEPLRLMLDALLERAAQLPPAVAHYVRMLASEPQLAAALQGNGPDDILTGAAVMARLHTAFADALRELVAIVDPAGGPVGTGFDLDGVRSSPPRPRRRQWRRSRRRRRRGAGGRRRRRCRS